jgi:hypothetical protein
MVTMYTSDELLEAQNCLAANGCVVLTTKAYHAAQRRHVIARHEAQWCRDELARTQRWAEQDLGLEIRRLRERVTFLYGAAIAAGATREELAG